GRWGRALGSPAQTYSLARSARSLRNSHSPGHARPHALRYCSPPMKRLLYVCLDGLGDDPIPEFGGRTPLEAADTPFLDSLARRGRLGSVTTVGEGIAPESDIAVFAILGYDPREEHPGRGVVEAVGTGMEF